jgi:hypothetical protein
MYTTTLLCGEDSMGRFGWRSRNGDIERALRGQRAEPRSEFTEELAAHVRASRPARPRAWSRAAFATAIAVFMLGTFASFGGIGYAASGGATAVDAVKRVVVTRTTTKRVKSSAQDQYSQPKVVTKTEVEVKEQQGGVAGESTPPPSTSEVGQPSGSLPFTGAGLLGTALLGATFLGAGIVLRRREQHS